MRINKKNNNKFPRAEMWKRREPQRFNLNLFLALSVSLRLCVMVFFFVPIFAFTQNTEAAHRATIQFGTETEIAALIQILRTENIDYLDDELITLIDNTRNQRILTGVFGFFGEREKLGLEDRAIRAITERDEETNETVQAAVDYLGKIKSADAVPILIELLNTEERRFLTTGFRALGRAGSATPELADIACDFLVNYYENRDPGADNQRELIIAIGTTGSSIGLQLLKDIVLDTHERIPLRIAALEALSKLGDPEGLDAILTCVGTNDPNVRAAAIGALGPFSGDEVDKAILDAFRDSYYRTRIAAAQASRERRLEAAVPYLQYRAERDDVPNVKDECIKALGAIANNEALEVLNTLFLERRNSDRVRLAAAEMLMKNDANGNVLKLIIELEDARVKNQTALYNGFLKILGESAVTESFDDYEAVTRRLINGTVVEKLYALDMAASNNLRSLSAEIIALTRERNESIARRARRTAEALGIEIPEEQ